jgi:hypothetical protein
MTQLYCAMNPVKQALSELLASVETPNPDTHQRASNRAGNHRDSSGISEQPQRDLRH